MGLELTPDPAHLADAPPLMACSDCGCLVVLAYLAAHNRVCGARIVDLLVRSGR